MPTARLVRAANRASQRGGVGLKRAEEVMEILEASIWSAHCADPESKGGSEASVRIAKADLVPHRPQPASRLWELRRAGGCLRGLLRAGQRPRAPDHRSGAGGDAGRGERAPAPALGLPHTLCFGETRKVSRQVTISIGRSPTRSPHELVGERVWARATDEQLRGSGAPPAARQREKAAFLAIGPGASRWLTR
jgi:hypothetical protein